jgi:hypothetical protein
MKNSLEANSTFADPELEALIQEKENQACFDCAGGSATWASVNNSIYLCGSCAGEHRSYGVGVSYIRSLILDKWNETQIKFMKLGGNRRLSELMKTFEAPSDTPRIILYYSKLLDFHRNSIKADVNSTVQPVPPNIKEGLLPLEKISNVQTSSSNYHSVGPSTSVSSDFPEESVQEKKGFFSNVGNAFSKAYEKTKEVAGNVKEKVKDMDIGTKIKDAGTKIKDTGYKTAEVVKTAASAAVEKGSELAVR